MRGIPPGTGSVAAASAGALALGVGGAAAVSGNLWGIPLALGGVVLLAWSLRQPRR